MSSVREEMLLTDEEIKDKWPDEVAIITPKLTQDDIEAELLRCARIIAKAQLNKILSLKYDNGEKKLGVIAEDQTVPENPIIPEDGYMLAWQVAEDFRNEIKANFKRIEVEE